MDRKHQDKLRAHQGVVAVHSIPLGLVPPLPPLHVLASVNNVTDEVVCGQSLVLLVWIRAGKGKRGSVLGRFGDLGRPRSLEACDQRIEFRGKGPPDVLAGVLHHQTNVLVHFEAHEVVMPFDHLQDRFCCCEPDLRLLLGREAAVVDQGVLKLELIHYILHRRWDCLLDIIRNVQVRAPGAEDIAKASHRGHEEIVRCPLVGDLLTLWRTRPSPPAPSPLLPRHRGSGWWRRQGIGQHRAHRGHYIQSGLLENVRRN
mmetsp:Transcript_3649/g.10374  ORF Transcript_3649/g.10374 Transcript_3649/m.10374 type:complete len:258 (-) Transcript_3649:1926-2699(-)